MSILYYMGIANYKTHGIQDRGMNRKFNQLRLFQNLSVVSIIHKCDTIFYPNTEFSFLTDRESKYRNKLIQKRLIDDELLANMPQFETGVDFLKDHFDKDSPASDDKEQ